MTSTFIMPPPPPPPTFPAALCFSLSLSHELISCTVLMYTRVLAHLKFICKSPANSWACHWWLICLKNDQQCICQVLWTWSHSHHASFWKPWHPLADGITNIINISLTTGIVPRDLKTAVVKPLLKKPSLDKNLLKNYRPISNLLFLSKILEKSRSPQTSLPSPKQPQQYLSVSLSSRTQHWDRFVTYCERYSLRSGQWHFCSSFVWSFYRFWHYWPPNSPLPPELCFWRSVYCTPMVSVIPLRQISVHFSQ